MQTRVITPRLRVLSRNGVIHHWIIIMPDQRSLTPPVYYTSSDRKDPPDDLARETRTVCQRLIWN